RPQVHHQPWTAQGAADAESRRAGPLLRLVAGGGAAAAGPAAQWTAAGGWCILSGATVGRLASPGALPPWWGHGVGAPGALRWGASVGRPSFGAAPDGRAVGPPWVSLSGSRLG